MIDIQDKKKCCGCNACGDICPRNAIRFKTDQEGFLYPSVDKSACIQCGLCDKVCPQLNPASPPPDAYPEAKCLAAVHKNFAVRFASTSGGAFSALADVIYRQKGFIGGAIWGEGFTIHQIISDNPDDLEKLRVSKYAQSDAQGFYKDVKDAVETGRPVLVCGAPCQMNALRKFIGSRPDNLYVIDYICRGNNSPLAFKKYLEWKEQKAGFRLITYRAKSKELGWRNLTSKFVYENGSVEYETRDKSEMTRLYLSLNAFCRPCCYECAFKSLPRCADITLADCWGVKGKLPKELDGDVGTSLVMLNSKRGEDLFSRAQKLMRTMEMAFVDAKAGNPMLVKSLPPPFRDRREIFEELNANGFAGIVDRYLPERRMSFKARIKRIVRRYCYLFWYVHLSPFVAIRLLRLNGLRKIFAGKPLFLSRLPSIVENHGSITIGGDWKLDCGRYAHSTDPSRIYVEKGGRIVTRNSYGCMQGADIQVFCNGFLEIEGGGGFNVGATIICANHIKIGKGVQCGRHICIRDNNGGHYMNIPGYKDQAPVEIGDHVWLCEGCVIMPGAKVGTGSVVAAHAVVHGRVPPNTMVAGDPAKVIAENIEWKY